MKLLDPKSDITFKKIFGENERILIALLNAILKLPVPIVKVNYFTNEIHPEWEDGKNSIVDIRCTDDLGRQFIVEMQMIYYPSFLQRAIYNTAKLFSKQLVAGDDFSDLKPVYSINFLVKSAFPNEKEFINTFKVTNTKNIEHTIGDVEFIFVELEKWQNLAKFDEENLLDHWLKYFMDPNFYKNLSKEDIEKYGFVTDALKGLELSSYTLEQLDAHERYLDRVRTHNSIMRGALEQGRKEGMEKGLEEGREKGLEEGREKGLEEGREKGMIEGREEGREEGVQLAFEMLLLLMQDIKSANFSNNELCIKYNVPESYIQQLVSLAN
jgi:predicted transposase/invertase (TIGR01784 family)